MDVSKLSRITVFARYNELLYGTRSGTFTARRPGVLRASISEKETLILRAFYKHDIYHRRGPHTSFIVQ